MGLPTWRAIAAESFGTALLTMGCAWKSASKSPEHQYAGAFFLTALVYIYGGISGAHFNPAVSLGAAIVGSLSWLGFAVYAAVQFASATLGLMLVVAAQKADGAALLGLTATPEPATWYAWIPPAIGTLMLVGAVLHSACADATRGNQYFGLCIGLALLSTMVSNTGMVNPAISFANDANLAIFGSETGFRFWSLLVMFSSFAGAVTAAVFFLVVRGEKTNANVARYLVEFVGSSALGFMYISALLQGDAATGLSGEAAAGLTTLATLTVLVFMWGDISGGHFNPAVSVAVMCSGRELLFGMDALIYSALQFTGVFIGMLTAYATTHVAADTPIKPMDKGLWCTRTMESFLFTGLLCSAVLVSATSKRPLTALFGLVIGVAAYVGCLNNCAMTFGTEMLGLISKSKDTEGSVWGLIFILVQLAAGACSGLLFGLMMPEEFQEDKVVSDDEEKQSLRKRA